MIPATLRPLPMEQMRELTIGETGKIGGDTMDIMLPGGAPVAWYLHELGMGVFEDPQGYLWVGVRAPEYPEHLRWLYVLERAELERAGSWGSATFLDVDYHVPDVILDEEGVPSETSYDDLRQDLELLYDVLREEILKLHPGLSDDEQRALLSRGLQLWQTLDYEHFVDASQLWQLQWNEKMHDLIQHYDRFQIQNPEFQGIPHQLALRAHGLGHHADQLAGQAETPDQLTEKRCDLG
jgi:hypothetical protein